MSKIINRNVKQIKSDILKCFQIKNNWYRKELIEEVLKSFNLNEVELKDYNSSSTLVKAMSMIGSVISSMLSNGDLSIDNGKIITLGNDDSILIRDAKVEIFLKEYFLLHKDSLYFSLFEKAQIYFKTNLTQALKDDDELEKQLKDKLDYLIKTNYIKFKNGTYLFNKDHPYPNTEIGNCLNDCHFNGNIYERFIEAININGGEFLEKYAVDLLSTYFISTNHKLLKNNVTGGSNDGGLDGIIEIVDELGYFEKIFIQTKARNRVQVTAKEVREFYGALTAEKGTRGIFVTNSTYHPLAQEFIQKTNNLIGIDGIQLFDLALKCKYGITNKNGKLILDEKIFINK